MKKIIEMFVTALVMAIMVVFLSYLIGSIKDNRYIDTKSEEFYNNYIDMRQVTNYTATENGLQLYLSDGIGYYWER